MKFLCVKIFQMCRITQTKTADFRIVKSRVSASPALNNPAQVELQWELRGESLHESFLNSHTPVKREQELHESWRELRSESLYESFLNSHTRRSNEKKSCMRVDEKWEFAWEFSQLSCPGQTRTRVDESWLDITARVAKILMIKSQQNLNHLKIEWESWIATMLPVMLLFHFNDILN
jgi:hypothetical protein